jgi:hypothetical protein
VSEKDPGEIIRELGVAVRRTWILGGVLPLLGFLALVLLVGFYQLGPQGLGERRVEGTFEAILAIAAVVFLIAFSLDSYWSSGERLGGALERAQIAGDPPKAAAHVAETMRDTNSALTLMGNAIGAAAVLAAYAAGDVTYGLQLIVLGACYHLFFLSRHSHYARLVEAAAEGSLLAPPDEAVADNHAPQEAHDEAP